ncbi:MAG: hypothetical protein CBD58_02275 [bacterium TMED198]|nr:MAG: hypothetical protein CBD58_02275 [bacterium TMED198]|tara:strand:- start:4843 stop:5553 length:711 start_codon:yes stop_codon:yes gene_type:complete
MKNLIKTSLLLFLSIFITSCDEDSSSQAEISGCTDESAFNYNLEATIDDDSCIDAILGCTDESNIQFNPDANVDDGSCCTIVCSEILTQDGCTTDCCTWTIDPAASASGGLAETNDFNITTGSTENGATRVIGFSLTGSSITDDQGTLISIESESTPSSLDNIIIAGLTGTTEDLDEDGQPDENITVTFWDGTGSPPSGNYLYLESVGGNTWNINFNIIPSIYGLQLDIIFSGTCS